MDTSEGLSEENTKEKAISDDVLTRIETAQCCYIKERFGVNLNLTILWQPSLQRKLNHFFKSIIFVKFEF